METKARYVLIGAFTLAGFVGLLAFLLWFARVELDRQFSYYDIAFPSVSGLSNASDVRFAGLPVGQVVFVGLSPEGDGTVRVRVEIVADTPVRADSIGTIESQGVTGVSFVAISPGTPEAPLLVRPDGGAIPRLEAGRSVLQTLSEDAPELLAEALNIVREVSAILSGENRDRISNILSNVENATGEFAQALSDFSGVAGSVAEFATEISRFNNTLEEVTGSLNQVLTTADTTIAEIGGLTTEARAALAVGVETVTAAQAVVAQAERYIAQDLTGTTQEVQRTVAQLRTQIDGLSGEASAMMEAFTGTGTTATARLTEAADLLATANAAITRLDGTLASIETVASNLDVLITGDGTALVVETRAMIADAGEAVRIIADTARTDLPAIMAELRGATTQATQAITAISNDLTRTTGRIDGLAEAAQVTLQSVTTTFTNANETLTAINAALVTGDAALAAATRTFQGADRVINEDVAGITADLRSTLATLNAAIGQVADDIPAITTDLRAAAATAESTFAELGRIVETSGGALNVFTTTALPDFTRLARETRTLIGNLDGLTNQIQRDPARFFLNQRVPDFRR